MNFNFIEINDSTIQIYGEVNGFANKVYFQGRKVWRYSITFFQADKQIKLATSEREGTLSNVDSLKKNILKKVTEKY